MDTTPTKCFDCGDTFERGELRPWKYEPNILLCENCFECRKQEEDED